MITEIPTLTFLHNRRRRSLDLTFPNIHGLEKLESLTMRKAKFSWMTKTIVDVGKPRGISRNQPNEEIWIR